MLNFFRFRFSYNKKNVNNWTYCTTKSCRKITRESLHLTKNSAMTQNWLPTITSRIRGVSYSIRASKLIEHLQGFKSELETFKANV